MHFFLLAERFLDERRLLGARFDLDLPPFALEADRRRDFERPLDALRFLEQLLLREQLRFLERLLDLRPLDVERLLLPPFDFDRAFEQDFERDRDCFFVAAFFTAAFLFGQELLLRFCSSSSAAASLDRDLLPAIFNCKLFQTWNLIRK